MRVAEPKPTKCDLLRSPLLTSNPWRAMLSVAIDRAMAGHRYRLAALVYLPTIHGLQPNS
jgi:hypothetical protein